MLKHVSVMLETDDQPFFTTGNVISGRIVVRVRRPEVRLGRAFLSLTCEETIGKKTHWHYSQVQTIDEIPHELARGNYDFDFNIPLRTDIDTCPSEIFLDTKHGEKFGVFWAIDLRFDHAMMLNTRTLITVFPERSITAAVLDDLDLEEASDGPTSTRFDVMQEKIAVIVSSNADADSKQPKLWVPLVKLFGEQYRRPRADELGEITAKMKMYIPKSGLLQTPHKARMGVTAHTTVGNTLVLADCSVKLVARVTVLRTGEVLEEETKIYQCEPEIILPHGTANLSDEFADLEIPATPESTATAELTLDYELHTTFVFRARNMLNMSRWHTVRCPVKVLPATFGITYESGSTNGLIQPPPYQS